MLLPSQAQLEDWPAFLNSSQAVMQAKFPFLQALPAMGPSLKRHGLQESAERSVVLSITQADHMAGAPRVIPGFTKLARVLKVCGCLIHPLPDSQEPPGDGVK